jgi:hypothetical protein
MLSSYKVECAICGDIINVPRDKQRSNYENVACYGMGAVLERFHRTMHVKRHISEGYRASECNGTIISPNGDEITQY